MCQLVVYVLFVSLLSCLSFVSFVLSVSCVSFVSCVGMHVSSYLVRRLAASQGTEVVEQQLVSFSHIHFLQFFVSFVLSVSYVSFVFCHVHVCGDACILGV